MALMTAKISHYGPEYAVLLTFFTGIVILVAGFLRLGFLIDFFSLPVIAGFTSAAAITIASSQVEDYTWPLFPNNWSFLISVEESFGGVCGCRA